LDAILRSLCELCVIDAEIAASDVHVGWIVKPLGILSAVSLAWLHGYFHTDILLR
jgi:hypothetical protein